MDTVESVDTLKINAGRKRDNNVKMKKSGQILRLMDFRMKIMRFHHSMLLGKNSICEGATWCADSRATKHMSDQKWMIVNFKKIVPSSLEKLNF